MLFGIVIEFHYTDQSVVTPLRDTSMRHDWIFDSNGDAHNIVLPVPLLLIVPVGFYFFSSWRAKRVEGREEDSQSTTS